MPKSPNTELPPVAIRLRLWRTHLKLTQVQMAETLRIDVGVLRKYENGINTPGGRFLISLGETGLNLNWLLLGHGEMSAGEAGSENANDRRIDALKGLLEGLEQGRRNAVLEEIFSRVQEAKRIADLEGLVREIARKL